MKFSFVYENAGFPTLVPLYKISSCNYNANFILQFHSINATIALPRAFSAFSIA